MGIRQIVTAPNPVLREKAKRVQKITSETQRLIDDMVETMRLAPGVGLAAPQVGVSQRVIVVEYAEPIEEGAGRGRGPASSSTDLGETSASSDLAELSRSVEPLGQAAQARARSTLSLSKGRGPEASVPSLDLAEPSRSAEPPVPRLAEAKPAKLYALINPEITRHSEELEAGNEGCLSIPGYMGAVERFTWATVKGQDRHGKPFKLKARGWLARVFQHEIDHLDGVLFIDRATRVWKMEPEEEQQASATV